MFHYTVDVPTGMDETIERLEENLKQEGFGVLWRFSVTEKLQEKGLDFSTPMVIFEVCNPQEAARVLNENLLVGYFCRANSSSIKRTAQRKSACRSRQCLLAW